jgi:hypothetical protein
MFHEPPKDFLYVSYKTEVDHLDNHGTLKSGIATAFILEINGIPWIVTNRHVIDLDYRQQTARYKNFALNNFLLTGRRPDDSTYIFRLHKDAKYYFHEDEENDVVLIEARGELEGAEAFHWHFGMEHLANVEVFKTIQPFDLICYSGFPSQYDKFGDRPIIRSGRIASDPRYNYSWNKNSYGQCVAYEGFSSEGASGSPIFAPPRGMEHIQNSRHGYLIGVNAGHVHDASISHSGISYFYKSTVIFEIIEKYELEVIFHT